MIHPKRQSSRCDVLDRAVLARATVLGVACAFLCGQVKIADAWNSTGHMAIAAIAYDHLTPRAKRNVNALLAAHRDHSMWLTEMNSSYQQPFRFEFMKAATWPDDIRKTPDDRPTWHYIDVPVIAPGFVPAISSTTIPTPNAETQIGVETLILRSPTASTEDKSVALCWVEHLIGDIHQPLHVSTYFSKDFPFGDKGGNREVLLESEVASDPIESVARPRKLHAFWDDLFGITKDPEEIDAMAARIEARVPNQSVRSLLHTHRTVVSWVSEGHAVAAMDVYKNGKLPIYYDPARATYLVRITPEYIKMAHRIADRQAVLAGIRLANTLNAALGRP